MNHTIQITKLDAASRQLNIAIRLLFEEAEIIAVHTIAGAASILYSNILSKTEPNESWDIKAQVACELAPVEYYKIMRKTQNFLKHADKDTEETLEFDPMDTEALLFGAVMNAVDIPPMSVEAQVFQLWYIASHWPLSDENQTPFADAVLLFGDLRKTLRQDRMKIGLKVLKFELEKPSLHHSMQQSPP